MKFPCPHCGQRVSATQDFSGTEATCPGCANRFVVPAFQEQPPPLPKRASSNRLELEFLVPICILALILPAQIIFGNQLGLSTVGVSITGIFTILLGGKGFSPRGIPLTSKRNITGKPAYVIGVIVMLIGVSMFFLRDLLLAYLLTW